MKFAGLDIAEMSRLPLARTRRDAGADAEGRAGLAKLGKAHPDRALVAQRIAEDLRRG